MHLKRALAVATASGACILALQAIGGQAASAAGVLSVTSVTPTSGIDTGGTTVTITGSDFTGATAVTFGSANAAVFTVDSDTEITATAPAGTVGGGPVTVVTPIGASAFSPGDTYIYETAPVVQSFQPFTGSTAGGNRVSINGSGFTGATAVMFGSTPAASFTVLGSTLIFAYPPAHSPGSVPVSVTTPGGTGTSRTDYYYVTPLTVTGVSPASGSTAGGNTVTITGTGFTDVSLVNFGSFRATSFTVDSDTQITAIAPAGTAGTVDVIVFAAGAGNSATSAADQYTYQVPTCTTTITGTSGEQITATSGLTCLINATQNGQVTVEPGAALSVTNSTINGTVTATRPAGITFCGATEHGALSVTGPTQGPVILGGTLADGTACAADTIPSAVTINGATSPVTVTGLNQNGTLTLENDSDGITLDGSRVNGLAYVENNTSPLTAGIMVSGNTVTGSLYCTGNNPDPIDYGAINTVSGTASGQCAAIATR